MNESIYGRIRCLSALLAIMALLCLGCGGERELPEVPIEINLIENPSFESWENDIPAGWELRHMDGDGEVTNRYGRATNEKWDGESSFMLRGVYDTDRWMVLVQRVPVIPGYKMIVSAMMKTVNLRMVGDNNKDRANFYVRYLDDEGNRLEDEEYADFHTIPRIGTTKWGRGGRKVSIPENAYYAEFGLINQMTGRMYFDHVSLRLERPLPWKMVEKKHVKYHYFEEYPPPKNAIDDQGKIMKDLVKLFDIDPEEKLKYFYYSDEKYMEVFNSDTIIQRSWFDEMELHTTSPTENNDVIHFLLAKISRPPIGLSRGVIFALRGLPDGTDIHLLTKSHLLDKSLPALYKIYRHEELKNHNPAVTITAWGSFCKYLIDRAGMDKFMQLYRESNMALDAITFKNVFRNVYGEDFETVDRGWRLFLLRYSPRKEGDAAP